MEKLPRTLTQVFVLILLMKFNESLSVEDKDCKLKLKELKSSPDFRRPCDTDCQRQICARLVHDDVGRVKFWCCDGAKSDLTDRRDDCAGSEFVFPEGGSRDDSQRTLCGKQRAKLVVYMILFGVAAFVAICIAACCVWSCCEKTTVKRAPAAATPRSAAASRLAAAPNSTAAPRQHVANSTTNFDDSVVVHHPLTASPRARGVAGGVAPSAPDFDDVASESPDPAAGIILPPSYDEAISTSYDANSPYHPAPRPSPYPTPQHAASQLDLLASPQREYQSFLSQPPPAYDVQGPRY